MDFVTRLFAWLTGALGHRRTPGRHSRTDAPPAAPVAPSQPSPYVCGARLVAARWLRERRAPDVPTLPEPRAQWFPPAPWERPLTLVRPYVLASLGEDWRHAEPGKGA